MSQTILAIDDENDVLMSIKTGLKMEGFEVLTASNGVDGLALAIQETPDLILLDVMMPGLDGFEVLSKLKEENKTCTIPVVMLTVLADRKRIQQALGSGANYYITKPFDFEDLLTRVRHALKARKDDDDGPAIEID